MISDSSILHVGTRTFELRFEKKIDPIVHDQVLRCADALQKSQLEGIESIFITYHSVGIHLNEDVPSSFTRILHDWFEHWKRADGERSISDHPRIEVLHRIPVRFGGEDGPDLPDLSRFARISEADVIRMFCESAYRVYMTGFIGGFPYLGIVPEALRMPRRAEPRMRVAPGSVGIAAYQAGIYPVETPGGWNLIGRTEVDIQALQLQPGDAIRFVEAHRD